MAALTWSLFGLLAALVAAVIAALFQFSGRFDATNSRIDALGARLDDRIDATNARIDDLSTGLNTRIDGTNARLDAVMGAVQDLGRRLTDRGF